jgi:hypothetical protein
MKEYAERCKFKHALAFLQFRRKIPDAKLTQLLEIFEDRKKYIELVVKKIELLRQMKVKGQQIPIPPPYVSQKDPKGRSTTITEIDETLKTEPVLDCEESNKSL